MAFHYVWSGAGGAGNGTSWANAYTKLASAMARPNTDNPIYVAHDHAETQATPLTLTSTGQPYNPKIVICVNRLGTVPPLPADRRATAQVSVTGTNYLTFAGSAFFDGIIFNASFGTFGNSGIVLHSIKDHMLRFDNCSLRLLTPDPYVVSFAIGGGTSITGALVEFNNTTLQFGHASHTLKIANGFRWRNTATALLGAVYPTNLLAPITGCGGYADLIGVDLSAMAAGKTIVDASQDMQGFRFNLLDCKISATVNRVNTGIAGYGSVSVVDFTRTSPSGNFAFYRVNKSGILKEDNTVYRSGGANDGTTPISWKVDSGFHANWVTPFETPPIAIWNDPVNAVRTATVECQFVHGSVAPNTADIWLEVEYLGSAASPQASFVQNGLASIMTVGTTYPASTATWTGTPQQKFKAAVSFTAQQRGWIFARIKVARPSNTFYVDPVVTLS